MSETLQEMIERVFKLEEGEIVAIVSEKDGVTGFACLEFEPLKTHPELIAGYLEQARRVREETRQEAIADGRIKIAN